MDIPFAVYQFFSGEDHLDLNLPVIGAIAVLFLLSNLIIYHSGHASKPLPNQVAWFIGKLVIILVLGMASIKLAIFIGIYIILLAGKVSFLLARAASARTWKTLHGIAFVLLYFVVLVALVTAGILLHFIYELVFGIAGGIAFITFNLSKPTPRQGNMLGLAAFHSIKDAPRHVKAGFVGAIVMGGIFPLGLAGGIMRVEHVMLPMRDGVCLATTVYRPAWEAGSIPVVLVRTPYNKDGLVETAIQWYNKGYIVVTQDTRGSYASEGEFDAFLKTGYDGFDTCAWIAKQSWCSGSIGTTGGSALSMAQYPMAGLGAPGLVAQEMVIGTPDLYDQYFRGGAWMDCDVGGWIRANTYDNATLGNEIIDSILAHPDKNSSFWIPSSLVAGNKYASVNARAIHVAGWYDLFQQNTINGFMGYYYNGSTFARGHQKLVIGPWVHALNAESIQGMFNFPSARDPVGAKWREAIFNENLHPAALSTGAIDAPSVWNQPNIAYYVMGDVVDQDSGANHWRFANDWPVPGYHDTTLYLQPDGSLAWSTPGSDNNFSYVYDPAHPMQTMGGTNLVFNNSLVYDPVSVHDVSIGWGMWDQGPLLNRTDVLAFNSSVLLEDVEAIGNVRARLFISSNCTNTDFVAKLCDVYPTGQSMLVADGILNTRKRNDINKNEAMTPFQTYEVTVDLWSTAYRFGAGHRIQLIISSSNAPKYAPCPNTGAPLNRTYSSFFHARNTVHVDPTRPSCIYLPIGIS